MNKLLDSLGPIDWDDFERAAATTKEVVRELAADKAGLREMIYSIEDDPYRLSKCERHYLLDKFVLYDALDRGFRVRLHMSTNNHLDRPHDHRFSFTTLILTGTYQHIWHHVHKNVDDTLELSDVEPVFITNEEVGSCYTLHHTAVHTTFTTPNSVSLVIRGPAEKERSIITERHTGKIWWRYGEQAESAERRRDKVMSMEDYKALRANVEALGVI